MVDLEADLILAAEVRPATLADSLAAAQLNLKAAVSEAVIEEAADKGYHAAGTIELRDFLDMRTYIPEPKLKKQAGCADHPESERKAAASPRIAPASANNQCNAQMAQTLGLISALIIDCSDWNG